MSETSLSLTLSWFNYYILFYFTDMAPYYRIVTSTSTLPLDNTLLQTMEKQNQEELEKLDQRLKEAEETEGETDIADALRSKANYLTRIGEKVR